MEGMNLAFKEECTQRAVLPVREFVPELTTWLASRSIMDCEFAERVEIDKSDWNAAQPLTMDRLKGYFKYVKGKQSKFAILSTGKYLELTKNGKKHDAPAAQKAAREHLDDYEALVSDPTALEDYDFDELAALNKSGYRITKIKDAAENKRHGMVGCNCTNYFKFGKCKHSLACAIHLGEMEIPAEYNMEIVGTEKTPGRPKKAKGGRALG